MDNVKEDKEVIAEETPVVKEEVKKEKPKKEDKSSWFLS
jgi:hypothetical protein